MPPAAQAPQPMASAADFLRLFSMDVGTDSVTYDATGPSLAPSKRVLRFDLPRVGLFSRVLVDFEAEFTAVEAGAAGQPAENGLAPFNLAERLQVKIGGSGSLIDLTGVGAHLCNELDKSVASSAFQVQPWPAPAGDVDVQHMVYAWDEAAIPPVATGTAKWGYVLPGSLHAGQPLGMVLLGTDRTLATVEITLADLDAIVAKAAFAAPTATIMTLTVRVTYEFFEVPGESAYGSFVQPILRYAHRLTEDRQDIVSVGPNANIVQLLPYDGILQVIQYFVLDGKLNATAIEAARFRLNRSVTRLEWIKATGWRQQREDINRDVPAVVWDFFDRQSLRSAVRAGDYTDIRTELDLAAGTTIAAGDYVSTITRKIVDLGAVAG